MKLSTVEKKIEEIEGVKSDYEHAHSLEDDLWREVLAAIANGEAKPSARKLAQAALKSRHIDFMRVTA